MIVNNYWHRHMHVNSDAITYCSCIMFKVMLILKLSGSPIIL